MTEMVLSSDKKLEQVKEEISNLMLRVIEDETIPLTERASVIKDLSSSASALDHLLY